MVRFELPWSRFPHPDGEPEAPRKPIRWRLWLSLGVGLLVVVVGLAIWFAPKVERVLSARSVEQAKELLREEDYHRAQLVLEQAVQANPANLDTKRELARFYADAGSPRALSIWRQIVALAPNGDADRVALATFALEVGDLATAREALNGVSPAGRANVAYHRAAAGLALRTNDRIALPRELSELALLEPDNPRAQFNHAAVDLAVGEDPARVAGAVAQLESLARGDTLRIRATLELIRRTSRQPAPDFTTLAERILPPRRGISYLLSWLAPKRGLVDLIAYMQGQPDPQPEDAALLADWMRRQGMVEEALFWLNERPASVLHSRPVLSVRAACAVQSRDWRGLEACLREGVWGRISDEALDLAFAALLQHEAGQQKHAHDTWSDALDEAGASMDSLHVLLRIAAETTWIDETESTLKRLVKLNPDEAGAWQALAAVDIARGDTAGLFALYVSWLEGVPGSAEAKGGQAWVSALLRRTWPEGDAPAGSPLASNPPWVAARALGLLTAGRAQEALSRLDALPLDAQADRRVLLARGLVLADLGRKAEAEQAWTAAAANPLLPQESALLQAGRAGHTPR